MFGYRITFTKYAPERKVRAQLEREQLSAFSANGTWLKITQQNTVWKGDTLSDRQGHKVGHISSAPGGYYTVRWFAYHARQGKGPIHSGSFSSSAQAAQFLTEYHNERAQDHITYEEYLEQLRADAYAA